MAWRTAHGHAAGPCRAFRVTLPDSFRPGDRRVTYMLLILEPHGQRAQRSDAEGRAVYERMLEYSQKLASRGVLRAAQSLKRDSEGVRVSVRDGKRTLVDGPFSESKEMIGG